MTIQPELRRPTCRRGANGRAAPRRDVGQRRLRRPARAASQAICSSCDVEDLRYGAREPPHRALDAATPRSGRTNALKGEQTGRGQEIRSCPVAFQGVTTLCRSAPAQRACAPIPARSQLTSAAGATGDACAQGPEAPTARGGAALGHAPEVRSPFRCHPLASRHSIVHACQPAVLRASDGFLMPL